LPVSFASRSVGYRNLSKFNSQFRPPTAWRLQVPAWATIGRVPSLIWWAYEHRARPDLGVAAGDAGGDG